MATMYNCNRCGKPRELLDLHGCSFEIDRSHRMALVLCDDCFAELMEAVDCVVPEDLRRSNTLELKKPAERKRSKYGTWFEEK